MPTITTLSSIITPAELRAMLGVAVKEFADPVVDLPIYKTSVKIACTRTDSRIWGLYAALPADDTTWSSDETDFADLFKAFVAWTTARLIAIALPQFSPQEIGNGQAIMQRNDNASEDVMANIAAQTAEIVPLLVAAAALLQPAQAAAVTTAYAVGTFGATGDPVTG